MSWWRCQYDYHQDLLKCEAGCRLECVAEAKGRMPSAPFGRTGLSAARVVLTYCHWKPAWLLKIFLELWFGLAWYGAEDLFGVVVWAGMVWCNSFPLRRQVHNNPPQVVGWQINDSLRGKHSHEPFELYKARNLWCEPSIRTTRYGGQMVGFRLTFCWATCQRRSLSNSSGTSNRRTP